MTGKIFLWLLAIFLLALIVALATRPKPSVAPELPVPTEPVATTTVPEVPERTSVVGYWECLPLRASTGPQTLECALGIAVDQSDGHFAVDTRLMSTYPVDFPAGTKVRVTGAITPANQLSSAQKYDIDGIISATTIEPI